jgi:hypothetical protein
MENFILNFLRLKTQKYFNEPTMYEEFKSLYEFGSQTQEEFLKELLSYSILFKEIYYEYENKNVNLIDFSKFTSSRYCSSVSMELLK